MNKANNSSSSLSIVEIAKQYAIKCHRETNHFRDGIHYDIAHLEPVVKYAEKYSYLVELEERKNFIAAAWLHDTIEDTRQTYNDIKKVTNEKIANLVYAVTNEKGKSRKERANEKFYSEMRSERYAVLLKLCDRLANVSYGIENKDGMVNMYVKDHKSFVQETFAPAYLDAFIELENLMELVTKN